MEYLQLLTACSLCCLFAIQFLLKLRLTALDFCPCWHSVHNHGRVVHPLATFLLVYLLSGVTMFEVFKTNYVDHLCSGMEHLVQLETKVSCLVSTQI